MSRAALFRLHIELRELLESRAQGQDVGVRSPEERHGDLHREFGSDAVEAGSLALRTSEQAWLRAYATEKCRRGREYVAAWRRLRRTALFAAWIAKDGAPVMGPVE